jgi:hypothetical protein
MVVVRSGQKSTQGLAIDCQCMCYPFGHWEQFWASTDADSADACGCWCPGDLIYFMADSASATP